MRRPKKEKAGVQTELAAEGGKAKGGGDKGPPEVGTVGCGAGRGVEDDGAETEEWGTAPGNDNPSTKAKNRKGQERTGKNRKEQERTGKNRKGQERTGKNRKE